MFEHAFIVLNSLLIAVVYSDVLSYERHYKSKRVSRLDYIVLITAPLFYSILYLLLHCKLNVKYRFAIRMNFSLVLLITTYVTIITYDPFHHLLNFAKELLQ